MKSFYKDYENIAIIKDWDGKSANEVFANWNKEVPIHVQNFNSFSEDRNAVIYLSLFVEYHINKAIEIVFPDFDLYLGISNTNINTKINILQSFRLLPKQIFEALRCIKEIRNEFAHELSIINLDDFKTLSQPRQKKTIEKLASLTNTYKGDYKYENHGAGMDTLRNRFKSLCLNTITAFRLFDNQIFELRKLKIEY